MNRRTQEASKTALGYIKMFLLIGLGFFLVGFVTGLAALGYVGLGLVIAFGMSWLQLHHVDSVGRGW